MVSRRKPLHVAQDGSTYIFTYRKESIWYNVWLYLFVPALFISAYFAYNQAGSNYTLTTPTEKISMGVFYFVVNVVVVLLIIFLGGIFFGAKKASFLVNQHGIKTSNGEAITYKAIGGLYIKTPRDIRIGAVHQDLLFWTSPTGQVFIRPHTSFTPFSAYHTYHEQGMIMKMVLSKNYEVRLRQSGGVEKVLVKRVREQTAVAIMNQISQLFQHSYA